MTEKIRNAMAVFEEDAAAGGQLLRSAMGADHKDFLLAAATLLKGQPESRGSQEVLKLLAASDQAVRQMSDPDLFSKEESIELARRVAGIEPQLDTKLVRLLPGRNGTASESATAATVERTLELLEAVSKCARILPALTHLLHDPNPRLRAKAALLMGRRVQNTQLVEGQMQGSDARVRANAIESLWGEKAMTASGVLWSAVKDKNNRVVGNALLGLYQARENGAVPRILKMAVDSAPLFRATAAWVMGQTADPRFLPVLEKLARDLYASVRKNAAKSTGLIRQSMGAAADNLQLRVLRSEQGEYQSVWIQAIGPDGATIRGLLPSQFVVWNGQNLVTDYEVIEHNTPGNVVAGLAVCREGALPAVTAGLEEKTPEHLWAITQIVSGGGEAADMAPAVYLADPNKLKATVADPPSKVLAGVETLAAIKSLLPAIIKIPGTRHLILFPESGFDSPTEIEPHIASATKHKVAIHAIVAGSPGNSLKSICDRTGGILVAIGDDADLGAEFQQLYSALSNHYVIRYRGEPAEGGATTVLRVQVYSGQGQGECSTAVTAATLSSVSA
jgi:hypothetical protein